MLAKNSALVSPPTLTLIQNTYLAQLQFRLTKTRPDTLSASLFKTFHKSLALSNLHPSTFDYHIRNSLHQLHIDPLVYPLPHISLTWPPCCIKVKNVPTGTYYALLLAPFSEWNFSTKPPCTSPTLIARRFLTFTLPVTTSSTVMFSNLHNTCALTLTNYPYSVFEPKPTPISHLTFTLPMTTHTPPMTNPIVSLAFPSRSWVTNSTPFYTVPTLPPSLILPSSALSALSLDMTSAPGPHTPHSNKLLFSLGLAFPNSSANTTKHGLTLPPLHAHNSSTHSNLTFSNFNPLPIPGPYHPSPPPLSAPLLMIHSARCVKTL